MPRGAANIISRFWKLPLKRPCSVSVRLRMVAGNTPVWTASVMVGAVEYAVEASTQSGACAEAMIRGFDALQRAQEELTA